MNTSEAVKLIEEKYTKNPLRLVYEGGKRTVYDPNERLTNKAFLKFCELWNKDEKSREFVKHLVRNFLPINPQNRVSSFTKEDKKERRDRCCIINIKMAGTEDIAFGMKKFVDEASRIDSQMEREGRKKRTKDERNYLYGLLNELPVEIKNTTIAYVNPKSNKTLSGEAVTALDLFVKELLEAGEKDMIEATTPRPPKRKKTKKKSNRKEGGISLGELCSSDVLRKLYGK